MIFKSKKFQVLNRLHRWLGVFLSLHILLLALTGAVLVFRHELSPTSQVHVAGNKVGSLQKLVDKSLERHPNDRVLAIGVDHENPERVSLRLGIDGSKKFRGARRLHFNRSNAESLDEVNDQTGFINTVLILHRELFLGTWGKLYVGFLGLVYAFILLTGMIIYGPMMKRASFGNLRSHLQPRQWWADLHKYFGALTFGWSLIIGLSGFLLGWGGPIIKFYQSSALDDLNAEFSSTSKDQAFVAVDQALIAAQEARPQGHFSFVAFPDTEFSTAHHYIFVMEGSTPLTKSLSDLVVVNAYDGKLERVLVLPLYLQLLLLAEPLHFGDYGGLFMKILWVIFGLGSMVLPLSGLLIFLQKYRQRLKATRSAAAAQRLSAKTTRSRPYALPLIIMGLCWTGMILALLVEGFEDTGANLLLAGALTLSFWFFIRNKRAVSAE